MFMTSFIHLFHLLMQILTSNLASAKVEITCIGAADAKNQVIFLHGIITETKTGPQPNYRTLLDQVAKDANLRIAMPISKDSCRGDTKKRCWVGNNGKQISTIWNNVLTASSQCIDTKKPFGLIGHSNGGYMGGRIIMRCLKPQPKWAVVGGAAGDISHAAEAESKNCAPLKVFIGKNDLTNQKAKKFVEQMQGKKRDATLIEYNGGHDFQLKSLVELILQLNKS